MALISTSAPSLKPHSGSLSPAYASGAGGGCLPGPATPSNITAPDPTASAPPAPGPAPIPGLSPAAPLSEGARDSCSGLPCLRPPSLLVRVPEEVEWVRLVEEGSRANERLGGPRGTSPSSAMGCGMLSKKTWVGLCGLQTVFQRSESWAHLLQVWLSHQRGWLVNGAATTTPAGDAAVCFPGKRGRDQGPFTHPWKALATSSPKGCSSRAASQASSRQDLRGGSSQVGSHQVIEKGAG